jgi:hypothetical protein
MGLCKVAVGLALVVVLSEAEFARIRQDALTRI